MSRSVRTYQVLTGILCLLSLTISGKCAILYTAGAESLSIWPGGKEFGNG